MNVHRETANSATPKPVSTARAAAESARLAAVVVLVAWVIAGCDRKPAPSSPPKPAALPTPSTVPAAAASPGESSLSEALLPIFVEIRDRKSGPARVKLRNHLNVHPDDGQACFLFGLTYHREKRYGEARPWFEDALRKSPNYAVTHYFLGWTLYYMGEPAESKREFETYLRSNPTEHDSHFALGLIALDEDDLPTAERLFKRSIELLVETKANDDAAMSRTKARLGEVYERTDRLAEARAELEAAVALYPDHYEALYRLYRVLVKQGEAQRAEEVHTQYLATRERVRPGTSFPE